MPSGASTSEGFTFRRIASGRLPHNPEAAQFSRGTTLRSPYIEHNGHGMPTEKNNLQAQLNKFEAQLPGLEDDIEFEDTRIETPLSLKEPTRSFTENGHETMGRTRASFQSHTDSRILSTPIKSHSKYNQNLGLDPAGRLASILDEAEFSDHDRELIRNDKIISDGNEFSPHKNAQKSPVKPMRASLFVKPLAPSKEIEFDPSDRESDKENEDIGPDKMLHNRHTPRRLSPLRKEIVSSSGGASELVSEIARSATKSRSTKQIMEQINTSIDELKERDLNNIIQAEEEEDDQEILPSLDSYLPRVPSTPPPPLSPHNEPPQKEYSPFIDQPPQVLEESLMPKKIRKKPTNRKLSGKYARDTLRKRKLTASNGKYEAWLYDKWERLKMLVELSVPNNALINSTIVMREFGCKTKEELAQRVKFLQRSLK